ncbi:hypothetical protein GCM10010335_33860 [Streptomyces galbus]|nr:hypothetical protein GCM10010335_33860 [Streptomyces galbus]
MLAVSKAASPYTAPAPETTSRTATDTFAPSGTSTDPIAALRTASWSVADSATGSTAASPLADPAGDGTAVVPGCAPARIHTVPPAVAPATATTARAVHSSRRRLREGLARRRLGAVGAVGDSMPAMLEPGAVPAVGRG